MRGGGRRGCARARTQLVNGVGCGLSVCVAKGQPEVQLCCCCCCCPVSLFVSESVNQLTTLRIRRIGLLHKCTNTRLQLTNLVCVCGSVCVCVFVCPVINMQMLIIIACHKSKRIELCARLGVCSTYFRTPLFALFGHGD